MAAVALALNGCAPAPDAPAEKISSFGEYSGYSEAMYDGSNRYSVYIPARDGTRLAVDYFLPTVEGEETADPLPVILHYTRYIRAREEENGLDSTATSDPVLRHMLEHGYAVAVADTPGSGASFGSRELEFSAKEASAAYDIIEWLAAQPWCDGNVGMHGRSYPGITQYHAATQAPPHLRAIFAEMAGPSLYDFIYRGGTYKEDFIQQWGEGTKQLDLGQAGTPARVDADVDGSLRDAAIAEHAQSGWAQDLAPYGKFRNWVRDLSNGGATSWKQLDTLDDAEAIDASGIAVYHLLGWFDIYTTQQSLMFGNLESAPQKMMIGPWTHSGGYGGRIHINEFHRWYDYWLKGIDNKVMQEAPIHYWVMSGNNTVPAVVDEMSSEDDVQSEDGTKWQVAHEWPPPEVEMTSYYLAPGPVGTVASANDGGLIQERPTEEGGRDDYRVEYTSTTGSFNRWRNGYGAAREEPEGSTFFDERTPEDERGLTYTSEALEEDLVLVGYPVVHLWLSSTHSDGDFFVYLEEVDGEGRSHYVTEGALRASYRALSKAPWNNFGLPFHRGHEEDLVPLPDEPRELVFDLMGTALVIDAGHRIRLTITGADAANHALYPDPEAGAPTISVYRDSMYASYIELPHYATE